MRRDKPVKRDRGVRRVPLGEHGGRDARKLKDMSRRQEEKDMGGDAECKEIN